MASGATCVQRLDDSRDSAIHTKYRILLRSSSMREPRYPLPRVVCATVTTTPPRRARDRGDGRALVRSVVPWRVPRRGSLYARGGRREAPLARARGTRGAGAPGASRTRPRVEEAGSRPLLRPPSREGCVTTCSRVVLLRRVSTMILPQVHLRKPCYDFSFL